jgi:hypothetical protein
MAESTVERAYAEAQQAVHFIPEGQYRAAAFQVMFMRLLQPDANLTAESSRQPIPKTNGHAKAPKSETKNRILAMIADGYFDDPRLPNEVRSELQTRGFHHNAADVRMSLLRMAQNRELRRLRQSDREFRYVKQ